MEKRLEAAATSRTRLKTEDRQLSQAESVQHNELFSLSGPSLAQASGRMGAFLMIGGTAEIMSR
jgi:hypothetical protein